MIYSATVTDIATNRKFDTEIYLPAGPRRYEDDIQWQVTMNPVINHFQTGHFQKMIDEKTFQFENGTVEIHSEVKECLEIKGHILLNDRYVRIPFINFDTKHISHIAPFAVAWLNKYGNSSSLWMDHGSNPIGWTYHWVSKPRITKINGVPTHVILTLEGNAIRFVR